MSISRRILIYVAFGTSTVMAVVVGLTYGLVYQAAEDRAVEHLQTYVHERTLRADTEFQIMYDQLLLVRGLLLKRASAPIPADVQNRWNGKFRRCPDGAWRKQPEIDDNLQYACFWGHRDIPLTPQLMHDILVTWDVADELLPTWIKSFPSLFLMFPDGMAITGFNPQQPDFDWKMPPDFDMAAQDWYKLATHEYNPSGGFAWTGVVPDPISGIPYASVLLPVEKDGRLFCIIGHDVNLEQLFGELTRSDFRGASHLIFQRDGRLIVHPDMREEILASAGKLRIHDSHNEHLKGLYKEIISGPAEKFQGYYALGDEYYAVSKIPGSEWLFVTVLPRKFVREEALSSAKWVWLAGVLALAGEMILLGLILRRMIAQPVGKLVKSTRQLAEGKRALPLEVWRQDELGVLSTSFNEMADRVQERDAALKAEKALLEERVADRTKELRITNENLRISERQLREALEAEKQLVRLKSDFVSLVSHEFRTPLEIITSSAFNLDRYLDRLPEEKRNNLISSIQRAVQRMAGMMEQVLLLGVLEPGGGNFKPLPMNISVFCRQICREVQEATHSRCPIEFSARPPIEAEARADEAALRHILTNLLTNAVKFSPKDSPVLLLLSQVGNDAMLIVSDAGCGIPAKDRETVFEAFRRGSNVGQTPGTGLGLVIVRRCVEAHGGRISCQSSEGQGTTFTIHLPVF